MKRFSRVLLLLCLGLAVTFLNGCAEKTLLPSANLTVTKVDPNILEITDGVQLNSSDPVKLPACTVSLRSENGVPARLISYSITYETRLGDTLPSLAIPSTPYDVDLPPSAETTITFNPYSDQAVELYLLTPSDIAPIRANISMVIKDVNGNTTLRTAHCLLWKPFVKS